MSNEGDGIPILSRDLFDNPQTIAALDIAMGEARTLVPGSLAKSCSTIGCEPLPWDAFP